MHKILGFTSLFVISTAFAGQMDSNKLNAERIQVAKEYIEDLQKADYKSIVQLFEKNGRVISTSRGNVDAKEFFYNFLPNITSATTEVHQLFTSVTDSNRVAVRFNFAFKLKDGEEGNGEYVDEFVFSNNSNKLAAVYMFENIKFTINTNKS